MRLRVSPMPHVISGPCADLGLRTQRILTFAVLSENDRGFPALTGRSGMRRTGSVLARRALRRLALVAIQRPRHYEGVPVRCSPVQGPPLLAVDGSSGASRGHARKV